MSSGPTAERKFESWGQGVYDISTKLPDHSGTFVLFAISDAARRWLGWYLFNTTWAIDGAAAQLPGHVLAEGSPAPSHFETPKPMTVEELTGPILYSRGNQFSGQSGLRQAAALWGRYNDPNGRLDIRLYIDKFEKSEHVKIPIRLLFKRKGNHGLPKDLGRGYVAFVRSEPFNYPTRHLNISQRTRALLCSAAGRFPLVN